MTARSTAPPVWRRYAACHICSTAAGQPCRNLLPTAADDSRIHPHPERLVEPDRDERGVMLLGHRADAVSSPYRGSALHAALDGVTVCGGERIAAGSWRVLPDVPRRARCQRPPCKRLWLAEEFR